MLKKTITYTDFDGEKKVEDFYFNLTKAELMEMEMSTDGGIQAMVKRIVDAKDNAGIIRVFKNIITTAYGVRPESGKGFIKTKELANAFEHSEAFSELLMELVEDENNAANFIKGILPAEFVEEMNKHA